ncbi:S-DNA-T family DNA segregation ATPase FtsK/SpoIIIE [Amycolatopsis lexingtonensis]|uniref:S-DNA-T family DNA segregation ATPase FtsK/SpoIIIE n=1 Tax=Amycolatopsis lexingtonensis TaxID=218822 RepID=A0ABR9HZ88_9PSEU|nr:type VII secretion protein EccCb [Amycolatopsis lexingtonensis]MBE1496262.1 S-DNA-T family DNA segregation ATPase FtsK/SpoIIIE [Amycolatopsis lexingtonensis]
MGERRALLIGTASYDDVTLPSLRAPAIETRRLWNLLKDPSIGGFRAKYLIDERKQVVEREIEELFADSRPDDHVLLYISGHGLKNGENELFFATTDTKQQRPYSTAIPVVVVQRLLHECQAQYKAIVLDCCYSGTFAAGPIAKSDNSVDVSLLGEGTYIVTATSAFDPAFEDDRVVFGNSQPFSLFTDVLIKGLDTGAAAAADADVITIDALYDYLHQELSRPRLGARVQVPHRLNQGQGAFVVAKARSRTLAVDEAASSPLLETLISLEPPNTVRELTVPIGQVHRSISPGSEVVRLDLAGPDGHVGIVGKAWSGKTTLLRTLIAGLRFGRTPEEVSFVLLDASAQLSDLAAVPHVREYVAPSAVGSSLAEVSKLMERRDQLFRSVGIGTMRRFRALRAKDKLPPGDNADIFIVIDGWEEFAEYEPTFAGQVRQLAIAGLSKGVHLILAARHWVEIPEPVDRFLIGRIELALDDPSTSRVDAELARALPVRPGWGLHNGRPFLVATTHLEDSDDELEAIDAALKRLSETTQMLDVGGGALLEDPTFLELFGLPGDAMTFDLEQARRRRPLQDRYRVPIGVDEQGRPVMLDLKEAAIGGMGPHGLCAGATGSGKTELLKTIIAGLMITHAPSELSVFLIDYKGSNGFPEFSRSPHVSGNLFDLAGDLTLVDRLRDTLAGEMTRRQEALTKGGYKSVGDYERARELGAEIEPLPMLLIVVDEVTELLAAKPEMTEAFRVIGQVGRVLHMHLLLATQHVDEELLGRLGTHLSYRIGLRTFTQAESRNVLGVPDAYELPSAPGGGYLRFEIASLVQFKAAYVSAPYLPQASNASDPSVRNVAAGSGRTALDTPSELEVLIARVAQRDETTHQVWLPPLTEPYPLDRLLPRLEETADRGLSPSGFIGNGKFLVPVGVIDRPLDQRRDILWADFSGAAGHAAIVGGYASGASALLRTLILSVALTQTAEEAQFYCLDFDDGSLQQLVGLPHVGEVTTSRAPDELVRRTVGEIGALVAERERLFRAEEIDAPATFRRRERAGELAGDPRGDVFLVIAGWETFADRFPETAGQVAGLAGASLAFGVHVILSGYRWSGIQSQLLDLVGTRLELRLADPDDSHIDSRAAATVPKRPGCGLTREKLPFLAALPRLDGQTGTEDLTSAVRAAVDRIAAAWTGARAPRVRVLPDPLPHDVVENEQSADSPRAIPIGLQESDLAPVFLDFDREPHFFALMDGEAGKTNLLRMIVRGIASRYTEKEALILLVDYRRTMLDFVRSEHLLGYAVSPEQLKSMMRDVAGSMRKRLPGPEVTREQLRDRSWWQGPELFIVVDDHDLVCPMGSEDPLSLAAVYLWQAKDIGLHLVVARRSGGPAEAASGGVLGTLKELKSPALQGAASELEMTVIGQVRPAELPRGRGTLVSRKYGEQFVRLPWVPPEANVEASPKSEPDVTPSAEPDNGELAASAAEPTEPESAAVVATPEAAPDREVAGSLPDPTGSAETENP